MSSGCGDVLTLEDLKTAKKHQIFEAEVITGLQGGVTGGASIDFAVNQVTGQTQKTLPAILRDAGFRPASFTFQTGGTLGVNDADLAVLWPIASGGDGNYYVWKGSLPKTIPAASSPTTTGGISDSAWVPAGDVALRTELSAVNGAYLIGDIFEADLANAISRREYVIDSVSTMVAMDFSSAPNGYYVKTLANQYGVKEVAHWKISTTQDTSTYSIAVVGGRYANLMPERVLMFSQVGFGGTAAQSKAAVDEGNRVARANNKIHKAVFPAGGYLVDAITLDVDRRGFTWDGAGMDATYLTSTTNGISLHHVLIDPRNRANDRNHYYQTVKGFTIDGNIDGNGAAAAQRTVCSAHYSTIAYKSVGHILSNVDLCGLVIHWKGLTGGRTNGATKTINSVRARYNSQKIDGYIGGADDNSVALLIHGPSTTLTANAAIGATTITVASASGLSVNDIVEISGGTLDAKIITGISGNTLTLDSGLLYAHSSGGQVRVPVYGTSVTGTIEVGQIQVGNSSATEIRGKYAEQSKIYMFGYVDVCEIHGNTIGQAAPAIQIDSVDRLSIIRIVANQTSFPINLNVPDRNGSINGILDLYMFPDIEVTQNSRAQNSVLINGTYAFKSIKVERFYDTGINDRAMTSFKFTGFSATAAVSTSNEVLRFAQNVATRGYDGHTYDLNAVIRRQNGTSGLLKRAGQTTIIGVQISDTTPANARTLNNYAFYDGTNGADVIVGSNTGRMGIVLKGEPAGGQSIMAMFSGEVVNIL